MFWIQFVNISELTMDCLKINSYLLALINCTRWTLRSSILGNHPSVGHVISLMPVNLIILIFLLSASFHSFFHFRCNILKRVPNSALWLLRFPAAGEMRLRACTWEFPFFSSPLFLSNFIQIVAKLGIEVLKINYHFIMITQ